MDKERFFHIKSVIQNLTDTFRDSHHKTNNSELNDTLNKILTWLSPENYPTELKTRNILFITLYTLVVIVSLFGNLFVCYVIIKRKRMRTTTNLLMINLTVSDLLMTIINIPFSIFRLLVDNWQLGNALCILVPLIQSTSVYVSSFTMTVIAIDRYQAIINPLHKRLSISVPLLVIITAIWIAALVFAFPNYLFLRVVVVGTNVHRCHDVSSQEGFFSRLHITLYTVATQYVIPLSITAFMYMRISFFIWCRLHDPCITSGIPVTVWMRSQTNQGGDTPPPNPAPLPITPAGQSKQLPDEINNNNVQNIIPVNEPEYSGVSAAAPVTILHDSSSKHSSNYYASIVAIRERSRRKTIKMLAIVVAVFALCWLPLNVYHVIADLTQSLTYDINLKLSFHVLAMSSVCYNPFIYFYLNHHYREEMKHLIKYVMNCSCLFSRRHDCTASHDRSVSPNSQYPPGLGFNGKHQTNNHNNPALRPKTPNVDGDHFNYDLTRNVSQRAVQKTFPAAYQTHHHHHHHHHHNHENTKNETNYTVTNTQQTNGCGGVGGVGVGGGGNKKLLDLGSGICYSKANSILHAQNTSISNKTKDERTCEEKCDSGKWDFRGGGGGGSGRHIGRRRNYYQHECSSSSATSCPIIGSKGPGITASGSLHPTAHQSSMNGAGAGSFTASSPPPSSCSGSGTPSSSSSSHHHPHHHHHHQHHECQIIFRAVSSHSTPHSAESLPTGAGCSGSGSGSVPSTNAQTPTQAATVLLKEVAKESPTKDRSSRVVTSLHSVESL